MILIIIISSSASIWLESQYVTGSQHVDILINVYIYFLTFFLLFLLGERVSAHQTYKIPFIVAVTVVGILAILLVVVLVLYRRVSQKKMIQGTSTLHSLDKKLLH